MRFHQLILLAACTLSIVGCDTITEMTKGTDNAIPATPLTDIQASVSLRNKK
jgi:hypothetical protein